MTEIVRETTGSKGRYVLRRDGAEAELTYSITSPTLVIADHTAVPDAFRGTGAGLALVTQLVADARAEGFKAGQENMRERAAWHEKQRGKGKEE